MVEPSIPKKRTCLYLEPNIWKNFLEICFREGISASSKAEDLFARYNIAHGKGNPNLLLTSFIGKSTKTCFFCEGHFQTLKKVEYISGLVAMTCNSCLEAHKRTVKKVLGVIT